MWRSFPCPLLVMHMCNPSSRRYVGWVPISLSLALLLDLATLTATTESQSPSSAWQDATVRTSFSATPVGIPGLLQSLYRVFVDPGSLCNPRRSGLRRFTSLFACLTLLVPLETHNLGEEASHKFKSSCGALYITALFLFSFFTYISCCILHFRTALVTFVLRWCPGFCLVQVASQPRRPIGAPPEVPTALDSEWTSDIQWLGRWLAISNPDWELLKDTSCG